MTDMTSQQALEILDMIVAQVKLSRVQHDQASIATQTLAQALQKLGTFELAEKAREAETKDTPEKTEEPQPLVEAALEKTKRK